MGFSHFPSKTGRAIGVGRGGMIIDTQAASGDGGGGGLQGPFDVASVTNIATLPTARDRMTAGFVSDTGFVYGTGGTDEGGVNPTPLSEVLEIDPGAGSVIKIGDLVNAVIQAAGTAPGDGFFYVFGGQDPQGGGTNYDTVQRVDPSDGSVTVVDNFSKTHALGDAGSPPGSNLCYVTAGANTGANGDECWEFDPSNNTSTLLGTYGATVSSHGTVAPGDGWVYRLGGAGSTEVRRLEISTGNTELVDTNGLGSAKTRCKAVILGDVSAYIPAGTNGTQYDHTSRYGTGDNSYTEDIGADFPFGMDENAVGADANTPAIYSIGGFDGGSVVNNIFELEMVEA